MFKSTRRCFCAFCRSPRSISQKRHISAFDIFTAGAAAALASVMVWQEFDPRATMFFALALGLAEIFIVLRWRMSVICKRCGFDPVLYKRAPEKAAARVNEHMRMLRESPESAFRTPVVLPVVRRKVDRAAQRTSAAAELPTVPASKLANKKDSAASAPLVPRAGNR